MARTRRNVIETKNGALVQWVGTSEGRDNPIAVHNGLGADLMSGELPEMLADKTDRPVMLYDVRRALGNFAADSLFKFGWHQPYSLYSILASAVSGRPMPTMSHYAMASEDTFRDQGVEQKDLAGFSWAGPKAIEIGLNSPSATGSIITLGAPLAIPDLSFAKPNFTVWGNMLRATRNKADLTPEDIGNTFGGSLVVDTSEMHPEEIAAHIEKLEAMGIYRAIDEETFEQQKFAITTTFHNLGRLASTNLPILAIGADQDLVVPPEHIRQYKTINPSVKTLIIKGEGHYFPYLRADETSDAVANFLSEVHGTESSPDLAA